jgi:hypothetical protein
MGGKEDFFFEKKKQKTFAGAVAGSMDEGFLCLLLMGQG